MVDRELISSLRLLHGSFNLLMLLLFFYQGWLGQRVRKARISGSPPPLAALKRHRQRGPLLVLFGLLGFGGGILVALLDHGTLLEHPLHLLVGFFLICSLVTTLVISRKIKGPESPWRKAHARLGIVILTLYPLQASLGLGVLL